MNYLIPERSLHLKNIAHEQEPRSEHEREFASFQITLLTRFCTSRLGYKQNHGSHLGLGRILNTGVVSG